TILYSSICSLDWRTACHDRRPSDPTRLAEEEKAAERAWERFLEECEAAERAQELHGLERVVDEGWYAYLRVRNALGAIRDRRLYRDTHATFTEYCEDRFGITWPAAPVIADTPSAATRWLLLREIPPDERTPDQRL